MMSRRNLLPLLLLTLLPAPAWPQSKTVLGSTNASSCYRESNRPASSYGIKYCTRAIEEDQLGRRDLAATYNNRGIIHAAHNKLEAAMADHDQAAEIAPKMGKVYLNRGNVHHRFQNYSRALADYDLAFSLGRIPLDVLHYNRALTLIKMQRWEDARASLQKALRARPGRLALQVKQLLATIDQLHPPAP